MVGLGSFNSSYLSHFEVFGMIVLLYLIMATIRVYSVSGIALFVCDVNRGIYAR